MQITWTDIHGTAFSGQIDAHILPFVEALGQDAAADLFIAHCGRYFTMTDCPTERSWLAQAVGVHAAKTVIAKLREYGSLDSDFRTPTPKRFMVRHLRSKGVGISAIASKLHMSDVSVRRYLKSDVEYRAEAVRRNEKRRAQVIADALADGLIEMKQPLTSAQNQAVVRGR